MADWNFIEDSEIDAGSPMNTTLFSRLARNPQAIAEGAEGAPPIQIGALGTIAAGNVPQFVVQGSIAVTGTSYEIVRGFTCLQGGTMRVSYTRTSSSILHYLHVDGVSVLTATNSVNLDISVEPGSQVWVRGRGDSSGGALVFNPITISTDGASPFFPVIPFS